MKKLTTLFILAILFITGLFAQSKIPFESYDDEEFEPYIFTSSDRQYSYTIRGCEAPYDKAKFSFIKWDILSDTTVSISITFDSKDIYDKFTKDFDISEIESEFTKLEKKVIKSGVKQRLSQKQDNNSKELKTTNIDPKKPYNIWYNCYCSPKLQLSDAKK